MNKTTLRVLENIIDMGKLIVIEGFISVSSQALRETSKTNYKRVNDDARQNINLIKNQINGSKVNRYSDI